MKSVFSITRIFKEIALYRTAHAERDSLLPHIKTITPRRTNATVVVLPGFMMGDRATEKLRRFLRDKGYSVHGWGLGKNLGISRRKCDDLKARLLDITNKEGNAKVILIGYSLGGLYAREFARQYPALIEQVITIASPFATDGATGLPTAPLRRLTEIYEGRIKNIDDSALAARSRSPLPVPSTAIYSRQDLIIATNDARGDEADRAENVEVAASHLGMLYSPDVYLVIADRLAQNTENWRPFKWSDYPDYRGQKPEQTTALDF